MYIKPFITKHRKAFLTYKRSILDSILTSSLLFPSELLIPFVGWLRPDESWEKASVAKSSFSCGKTYIKVFSGPIRWQRSMSAVAAT